MTQNYIERRSVKQGCQLRSVPMLQYDFIRNSRFLCCAFRYIQHRWRRIQQRDVKTKSRQAHRDGAGTAPEIQSVQRPCGLREKVLQVGKGEIEAQPALGRLEVGGILRCAGPEAFEVGIGSHFLHTPLMRVAPDASARSAGLAQFEST